jgi:hypothetical protein
MTPSSTDLVVAEGNALYSGSIFETLAMVDVQSKRERPFLLIGLVMEPSGG